MAVRGDKEIPGICIIIRVCVFMARFGGMFFEMQVYTLIEKRGHGSRFWQSSYISRYGSREVDR